MMVESPMNTPVVENPVKKKQGTHTKKNKATQVIKNEYTKFHPNGQKAFTSTQTITNTLENSEQKRYEEWMQEKRHREQQLIALHTISEKEMHQKKWFLERNIELYRAIQILKKEMIPFGTEWRSSPDLFAKICFEYPQCDVLLYLWPIEQILSFGSNPHFAQLYTTYTQIEVHELPFFFLEEAKITAFIQGSLLRGHSTHTKPYELETTTVFYSFDRLLFPNDHILEETQRTIMAIFDYDFCPLLPFSSIALSPNCFLTSHIYVPVHGLCIQFFPTEIRDQIEYAFHEPAFTGPSDPKLLL
jgi:hypothetical protein